MKILEAISDMNIGGAGVLLLTRLLTDTDRCKDTVVVIPTGSMLKKRFEKYGIAFLELDACKDCSFELSAVFKYIGVIRRLSPDIVNCHGCLSFRIAALLCGVPVRIYTRHCAFPLKRWQKNVLFRLFVGTAQTILSNGIIAVAEAAKEDLIAMGVPKDRITVIINGVRGLQAVSETERSKIKKSLGIEADSRVIGIFARLEKYKGHIDILRASEILSQKGVDHRVIIVGCGSMERELKLECQRRGLSRNIIFTGFVDDVSPFFNITDINVNCSYGTETSSLALSEGMSLGIPAVASNYGGNTYMVQDGINGLLYPVGDHVALANAIGSILKDEILYKKMSREAYERFERELNAKKMTEKTYFLYNKIWTLRYSEHPKILENN